MPHNQPTSLRVRAEAIGAQPCEWAWAIFCGTDSFVIARSRLEFSSRADALEAGGTAAAEVARRLGILHIEQDAD